jgi:hypothetical protein
MTLLWPRRKQTKGLSGKWEAEAERSRRTGRRKMKKLRCEFPLWVRLSKKLAP